MKKLITLLVTTLTITNITNTGIKEVFGNLKDNMHRHLNTKRGAELRITDFTNNIFKKIMENPDSYKKTKPNEEETIFSFNEDFPKQVKRDLFFLRPKGDYSWLNFTTIKNAKVQPNFFDPLIFCSSLKLQFNDNKTITSYPSKNSQKLYISTKNDVKELQKFEKNFAIGRRINQNETLQKQFNEVWGNGYYATE